VFVNPPNRRTVTLAGLSPIGAGGVLGLALTLPGAAVADPSPSTPNPSASNVSADRQSQPAGDLAAELGTEQSRPGHDGGPRGDGPEGDRPGR
jgi:hypothetical protein